MLKTPAVSAVLHTLSVKILSHLWFTLLSKDKKLLMLTSSSSLCILLRAAAVRSSCSAFACLIMDGSGEPRMVFPLFTWLCCSWQSLFDKNGLISLIAWTFSVSSHYLWRKITLLFVLSMSVPFICHTVN